MKAIVIGSGMGGMTAAIALRNFGHEVEVYERVEKLRPVGAAISVWSNGIKCLSFIGVGERAKALGGRMTSMAYLDGHTGETMCDFSLEPLVEEVGEAGYPIARAELQDMLHDAFGGEHLHMGKECVAIEDDGEQVTAHFSDGSSATGDVLVGADGTHSFTRRYVLCEQVERRYAGYVNWNGLVPIDTSIAPANRWTTWVGDGKRVSLMPVGGDRFYFFFDVPLPAGLANDRSTYRATLHDAFDGWDARVHALIDTLDVETTNRVEIYDIEPWHEWVRGRVALMGDAAHSTTPDIGQGGCQAMEDGVALAIALQVNALGVEDALLRYQRQRSGRAAEWVLRARKRCDVTHGKDPEATQAWYEELRHEDGERVLAGIAGNIHGSPVG